MADAKRTILFLSSNPNNEGRDHWDRERRGIGESIERGKNRDLLSFKEKWAVRVMDLRRALLDEKPNILHFASGKQGDGIVVETTQGTRATIEPQALGGLLQLFADQIQCVVLSGCFTPLQAEVISQEIGWVLGLEGDLSPEDRMEICTSFYDSLAAGKDEAFAGKIAKATAGMNGCDSGKVHIYYQGMPYPKDPEVKAEIDGEKDPIPDDESDFVNLTNIGHSNPSEPKPKREDYGLEMEEEDTEGESEAESALKAAIKKLKIRRPTELDLVNCNRRAEYNTFKRIFPSIQSKLGVFFIAGCHSQSPEALAERFFYESRKHKWRGREDSIHYVRENNNHSRVKIEKLSSIEEWDITGAQTSMRTYWEERFGPLTESKTYDEYVHEYLAKLQYSCIVSAFEIDAKTWDSCDYIHDFINWLSDPFTQIQGESPFFLFFIVVKARNAHIRNQMDDNTINALDDIKHFTEKSLKNPVNILGDFISGLDYVEINDVKDWFDKLDETNPERIEKCVELLGGQISAQDEQDIFWDKKKVNMWRILELQHKIYQIHNR